MQLKRDNDHVSNSCARENLDLTELGDMGLKWWTTGRRATTAVGSATQRGGGRSEEFSVLSALSVFVSPEFKDFVGAFTYSPENVQNASL